MELLHYSGSDFLTGSGSWKLVSRNGLQEVQLWFHEMEGRKPGTVSSGATLFVGGTGSNPRRIVRTSEVRQVGSAIFERFPGLGGVV